MAHLPFSIIFWFNLIFCSFIHPMFVWSADPWWTNTRSESWLSRSARRPRRPRWSGTTTAPPAPAGAKSPKSTPTLSTIRPPFYVAQTTQINMTALTPANLTLYSIVGTQLLINLLILHPFQDDVIFKLTSFSSQPHFRFDVIFKLASFSSWRLFQVDNFLVYSIFLPYAHIQTIK